MFKDLDFAHFFEIDEGVFRSKQNEIRRFVEKAISNIRLSGQSDGIKTQKGIITIKIIIYFVSIFIFPRGRMFVFRILKCFKLKREKYFECKI